MLAVNWIKALPYLILISVLIALVFTWNAYSSSQETVGSLRSDINVLNAAIERQQKESELLRSSAKATEEILVKEQDKRLEVEQQLSSSKASIAQLKKENNLLKRKGDNEVNTGIELSDDATRLLHESFCRTNKKHPDCTTR